MPKGVPIKLFHATTAGALPPAGSLTNGELALDALDTRPHIYTQGASGVIDLLGLWLPIANPAYTGGLTGGSNAVPALHNNFWGNIYVNRTSGGVGGQVAARLLSVATAGSVSTTVIDGDGRSLIMSSTTANTIRLFGDTGNVNFTGCLSGEPWTVMGLTPNGVGGGRHYIATAAAGAAIDWNYGTLNFWVDSGMTVGAATYNAPVRVSRTGLSIYGTINIPTATGGINNSGTTVLQASPTGGTNLVIRNQDCEVPGPVGGDSLPLQTGWPTIKLRTDASWDGGGLNTNERVYSNAILEMGQSGWSFAGIYRANDPVNGQLGGRSNQLRIRNNEFPTVGLVLDAITRTISISDSSLMLGANATQPLEAVPLQQLNAAIAGTGVTISATAPSTPAIGKLWFDSSSLQMFIYFNDGTNSQWVPVISQPR